MDGLFGEISESFCMQKEWWQRMKYLGIEKRVKLLYKYIIVWCIIFSSKDTWLSKNDNRFMFAGMAISIVLMLPLLIKRKYVNLRRMKIVSMLILLVCMSMIANFDFRGYSMFIVLCIALFATTIMDFEEFYQIFDDTIMAMSILSIIGVVCKITLQFHFLPHLIYMADNMSLPWGFRLWGMFREPAMYCIYLGLALGRHLFFLEKPVLIKVLVYLFALLLSGSATGYIAVLFAMACFCMINRGNRKYFYICILGMTGAILVGLRYGVLKYFLRRMSVHSDSGYSANSRYYSIIGGVFVGITHPLFGAGAVKSELRFLEFIDYLGESACWANMVTYLWAAFGTFFICIFLWGIYNVPTIKKRGSAISFFLFILLLLCGETMTYSSVMYIFMLYGYPGRNRQKDYLGGNVKRGGKYAVQRYMERNLDTKG